MRKFSNIIRVLCIIVPTLAFAWSTSCGNGGVATTLISIAVTPAAPSIAAGATQQFTATATYSDGTTQDLTLTVTWATSDAAVADFETPDTNGLATAISAGTATITATDVDTSISGSTDMTVAALSGTIVSLYSNNGVNWNDYIANDGADMFTATDTACNAAAAGPGYNTCLNGGLIRSVVVTGRGVCDGLTATDSLGVFNWVCDSNTNDVRMVSVGFADGMGLSDLIDFDTAAWQQMNVTVSRGGNAYLATDVTAWWGNTIVVNNTGAAMNEGEVHIVTINPSLKYTIGADKVALLIMPGVTIIGAGGDDVISATSRNFIWIEGAIGAPTDDRAIHWSGVKFSVVRGAFLRDANTDGVRLDTSSNNNYLDGISIMGGNTTDVGVRLNASTGNTINNIFATDVTSEGVYLTNNSTGNRATNITVANCWLGASIDSSDNIFINITLFNSANEGVILAQGDNVLMNSTVANTNDEGLYIQNNSNLIVNTTAVNNSNRGFRIEGTDKNTFENSVSAHNGGIGFNLSASSNNYFTGLLKVGSNGGGCVPGGGANPGLDASCNPTPISDFTRTIDVDLSNSFIAKASSDSVNADGATGIKAYNSINDWVNFENIFRGWGKEGTVFPNGDQRGQCAAGQDCSIWDWSMATADTAIRDVLSLPTGSDTIEHEWTDTTTTIFLRNSVEIMNDYIGNDNGLCESNETCLYTPNIGSYQGHGSLISAGDFTDGTITGVTLMQYETNGR